MSLPGFTIVGGETNKPNEKESNENSPVRFPIEQNNKQLPYQLPTWIYSPLDAPAHIQMAGCLKIKKTCCVALFPAQT